MVTLDCPELLWLGVTDANAPVKVVSLCRCPMMGCGEAELAPDGTLQSHPTSPCFSLEWRRLLRDGVIEYISEGGLPTEGAASFNFARRQPWSS